ncbi:MAG: hypothetical protein ACTHMD_02310, partial [Flavisolibacter sp.]
MKLKKLYATFSCVLLFLFSSSQQLTDLSKNQKSKQAVPAPDQQWQQRAIMELQQEACSFKNTAQKDFTAVNSKNNLGIQLSPAFYSLQYFKNGKNNSGWKASFVIQEVGGKRLNDGEAIVTKVSPNELHYQYERATIEYKNTAEGLRQNFIVKEKPGIANPVLVKMKIRSALHATVKNNQLVLKDDKGNGRLYYDALKVWDADGKILEASMRLIKNDLSIVVNDKGAVYPVTVDPLNHTPEWETSADGVLSSLLPDLRIEADYGYTVTGLGDVNGDGYDDVAIAAPAAPYLLNTAIVGAGAVYIYFGSATGLPTIPSKVLQSSTPIANALFGYSVAGGDVTGDGKNDIIIGAPLDQYTTTAKGLVSNPSVTVTAGKVYVFRGEDIASVASPAPFLTISLNGIDFFSVGVLGVLQSNVNVKALFGFSVAATEDMNGDGKGEVIVGAPGYASLDLVSVRTGAAYVYYSNDLSTNTPVSLQAPAASLLGITLPLNNLLFGFSVDGLGDYNKDGKPDVAVGAPAGIINGGDILGGSAYVYFGTGSGVSNSVGAQLIPSANLLGSVASLFGCSVRGVRDANGQRNGNVLCGAPGGNIINHLAGLKLKTGDLYVFKAKSVSAGASVIADQDLSSPRSGSLLTLLSSLHLDVTALFGFSTDNVLDINCDGYGDIIVGEPLSTGVGLINADVAGGAAFVFLGKPDGSYNTTPYWTLTTQTSPDLGINVASLVGYSVAGSRYVMGKKNGLRVLVGTPGRSLDFGTGLLNLGNTLSTLFSFAAGDNGVGKAYTFVLNSPCADADGDGIPDAIDVDDDNDGIPDRLEFAQSNNGYAVPATDPSADDDGDGIVNCKDPDYTGCGTINANGICRAFDKDGDGIPNHLDLDSDNDGLPDVVEAGGTDSNGDGRVDCSGNCDGDNDGLLSPVDLNNTTDGYISVLSKLSDGSVAGTTSGRILDTDGDGVPDFLDIDSDNDGIYDLVETGGADSNGDGRVDYAGAFAIVDSDNDGWINVYDADTNNDGDVTDATEGSTKALILSFDSNNDNLADSWSDGPAPDTFPVDFDSDNRPNYRDLDSDADGINDVLEAGGDDPDGNGLIGTGTPAVNSDGYANSLPAPLIATDPDVNNDGRPNDDNDLYQTPYYNGGGGIPSAFNPDQDGDSRPNFLDLDSDNDGINDIIEGRIDRDGNGVPDTQGQDADGDGMIDNKADVDRDGIADVVDFIDNQYGDGRSASGVSTPVNTDGVDSNPSKPDTDIVPDYLDLDSDNDGVFDVIEGGNSIYDQDGDGIVDCAGNVYTGCDPDLDGILLNVDGKPSQIGDAPGNSLPNTDGTDEEDYRDLDSNNNGNFDTVEKRAGLDEDTDNDGRVDGTDTDSDGIINVISIDNNNIYGGSTLANSPLPLHLLSFNGTNKGDKIVLSWMTENETDFDRFELQRSTN